MNRNTWPRDQYTGPGGGLYTGPGGGLYTGPAANPYRSNMPPKEELLKYLISHNMFAVLNRLLSARFFPQSLLIKYNL